MMFVLCVVLMALCYLLIVSLNTVLSVTYMLSCYISLILLMLLTTQFSVFHSVLPAVCDELVCTYISADGWSQGRWRQS